MDQYKSAIEEYSAAIARFEPKDSILIADSYFFRGQARSLEGELIQGMQDYQAAQLLYEALGDTEYVNYVYGGMAILYSRYEIFSEAEKIRNTLMAETKKENNNELSTQLFNQALDYREQKRDTDKLGYLLKAYSLIPFEPKDYYIEAFMKMVFSTYYGEHQDYEKQKVYFENAQSLIRYSPEISSSNTALLVAKSLMAKNQGNLQQAIQLAE